MTKLFTIIAAISGFLAVALGAFGAHGLRDILDPHAMAIFETGVRYQMLHTLALLGVAVLNRPATRLLTLSGGFFVVGILLFSGSLYLLALGGPSWLGPITPLGGLSFLSGWALLAVWAVRQRNEDIAV